MRNVIFDWSGTLSNDIYKACMKVFEKLGLKKISFSEFKRNFLLPYMKFYREISRLGTSTNES